MDFVIKELSFANLIMYGAVLPSYDKGNKEEGEEEINADDPKNKELVRKILYNE